MPRTAKKVGFAVAIKTAEGTYPRHTIVFKNGKPWRCQLNADAPLIEIPTEGPFYAVHAKGINPAKPETRATPLPGALAEALAAYQTFERNFQRSQAGLALVNDFAINQPPAADGVRVTISASIAKYLQTKKASDSSKDTIRAYAANLRDFQKSCGKEFIDELTQDDIIAYLVWMKANVKRRSVGQPNITLSKRLGYLNTFLKEFGKGDMWAKSNWPKAVKTKPNKYDDETLQAILNAAEPEEKIRLNFFVFTGCRDMEVAHAEYSDIDTKTNVFHIRNKPHLGWKPKDSEERDVVIPDPKFVKQLMERRAGSKNSLIFPNTVGKVDNNLIEFLQKAAKRAGIKERVTLHKIRRTIGSMYAKKFGIGNAQQFLGHSDIQTTARYIAADDMTSQKRRAEVEDAFAELVGTAR